MARRGGAERRVQYRLSLPEDLSSRFEALASKPGATKSAILAEALRALLDYRGASEAERLFSMRHDRISAQLARVERNTHVELESLALFVRYMLTVNAPLAEEEKVARALGRDRFAAFVARVGQTLARGRSTFDPEERP